MAPFVQAAVFFVGFSFIVMWNMMPGAAANDTYYIGFLAPWPSPSRDSLIPMQLAQEWQSAFRVALEVLNSENRTYHLEAVSANSACDWMKVLTISNVLEQKDIIGVVGPACSGAAISAMQYFDQGIPVVSFAATHESLSNRENYPDFFRTVYGDSHQTLAVLASMEKLDMWNVTILCTKDYYSLSLAGSIQQIAIERVSSLKVLDPGENSSINIDQLEGVLDGLQPNDFIILAVPPLAAEDIWRAAAKVGKTSYPWWYFGTDGATAFDPYIEDDTSDLVDALQGEIGLAPYGGDYSKNTVCQKYFDYWREKSYPGLPSMGLNKSRSYVPYLIDTVTLFFEIVDALVNANTTVNASTVLAALKGNGTGTPNFAGCTGNVQIDPQTGSRRIALDQPAMYDLVSLMNNSWELKGRIRNSTFVSMQPLTRPMSSAVEQSSYARSSKRNGGIIAGLVLFSVAFVLLLAIIIVYYKNRKSKSGSFVRIVH